MPYVSVDVLKNGKSVDVWYEECGNPRGVPLVYLHGGPGDAVSDAFKRQFDLSVFRLMLFDQRGCGKSKPRNHLEKNTTRYLIHDIETLRTKMEVEKWIVAGGSWGTSLALIYAEAFPDRVLGLLLRGVYDLSLDNCVLESVYPEDQDMIQTLTKSKSSKDAYRKTSAVLNKKSTNVTRRRLISVMENNEPLYVIDKAHPDTFKKQETLALIGHHYEKHNFFMPKGAIYKSIHKIRHIPMIMVQGRYDVVTPMNIAYKLSKLLPNCELRVVHAGHTMFERSIKKAMRVASTDLVQRIYESTT